MTIGAAKPLAAFALVGALGAGGSIYWLQQRAVVSEGTVAETRNALARATGELATCQHDKDSDHAAADQVASTLKGSQAELDALRAERAENAKRLEAFRTLTEKFQKMIDSGKLQVTMRHGRMIVKLPAEILFASGSADVSKEGQSALADVAGVLKQMPDRRFMIAGHTDNRPVGQPSLFKNNLQLSTARAETVTEQLITAGMNAAHLSAAGYSEYEPVRENSSESGRRENRRIEIVLLPNLTELPSVPPELSARPAASTSPSASASSAPPTASGAPAAPGPPTVR